jgi:hypothetical protein
MKIHIIAQRLEKERILPRLANSLVDGTGWTISDEPDIKADINYFFPYLELDRFKDFNITPIFAWFTHYDLAQPVKCQIWDSAAKRCSVRLTSALKYKKMLDPYGLTFIVTPPLDLGKFKPIR